MSERFEKTYISVHEFISSWEKEVYELSNLDYFTFLLINNLGYHIEHEFFSDQNKIPYLRIDLEEIATLSFNIGDSFESFLENNCFGDCSMSCPTNLNETVKPEERDLSEKQVHILQIVNGSDLSKKQFLMTDILNYVVLDTLFDFYNYEIGLNLDDADVGLMHFADFITKIIERFIEKKGPALLAHPNESAGELFEGQIEETEDNWDEDGPNAYDGEEEDIESWKIGDSAIAVICQEYLSNKTDNGADAKLINYFQAYAENYAGILQIDDLTREDLEEFLTFWLIREITLENELDISDIKGVFDHFFSWLEITKNVSLKDIYSGLINSCHKEIQRAVSASRRYFETNSFVDGVLAANSEDDQLVDGFFVVEKIFENGLLRLKDIHFKQVYFNVQVNMQETRQLAGMILDAGLKYTAYGWRIINLEYIFPSAALPYLH